MIKINRSIIISSALCLCAGFLSCSLLVNSYTKISEAQLENIQKLTELLEKSDESNKSLIEELENKEQTISDYKNAVSNDNDAIELLKEDLESARMASGLTELVGKGIIVTIYDSSNSSVGVDPSSLVIHDSDLLLFVNELNSAGAEAVSINGQRITSRSSIRCAGSIININGIRVAAPFVIKAIGEPEVLESALLFKGGVVDSLKPWGFDVEIEQVKNVSIEAYSQGISYKHASEPE